MADCQRAIATDRDQRIDAMFVEPIEEFAGAIDFEPSAVGLLNGKGGGVAPVGRADDGAALVNDAADTRCSGRRVRLLRIRQGAADR